MCKLDWISQYGEIVGGWVKATLVSPWSVLAKWYDLWPADWTGKHEKPKHKTLHTLYVLCQLLNQPT